METDSVGDIISLFSHIPLLDIKHSFTRSERPGGHLGAKQ